ncbi:MAG: hypothetical protein M0Z68_10025 [Gammaproteobacteria bacterium]|nr:hypothetical protein [Gammaproteobacteria bacterium]
MNKIVTDSWIMGDGADSDEAYVIHTTAPRFIAKCANCDPEQVPESYGVSVAVYIDDIVFFDISWIDPEPTSDEALVALFTACTGTLN